MILLLRSALFSSLLWTGVVVFAPLALLTTPLPFRFRYRFITLYPRFHNWLLKLLCGLDYEVEGRERLPSGAAVFMAKHQSTWETFAFAAVFPTYVYVLKRELMWIPLFGWAVALLRPIAIDRAAGRRAVEQVVEQGRRRLAHGISVMLFPEGTRMAPGTRGRYKLGGAILAVETGYPVVPIAHNAGSYWARRALVKRPGTVRVIIGEPIDPRGKTPEQIKNQVEHWIESTMARLAPN